MPAGPSGTVTFLFSDIEGSTKLWEKYPEEMKTALARHDLLMRAAITGNQGYVFKTVGDAFCAAFATAQDGLAATVAAQRSLAAEDWGAVGTVRVRMALHTGAAEERDSDYFGPPVNRVARLMSAGYGGQVLLSMPTYELIRDLLPDGINLQDMGSHPLKDLQRPEHIYQLVIAGLPAEFPPLKTLDLRPNNLPAQVTPFIGREKEIAAITQLLVRDDVRLLTLVGPGGTGKTRLALQTAADMTDEFEDGVFFVALAPITDPQLFAVAVAQAIGIHEDAGQSLLAGLKLYLREKQVLLVLDNFEQILDAAPLVSEILAAAPRVKILVTSREVLRVYGEHDFSVPPLVVPDPAHLPSLERLTQYEAVRLFIDRARSVKAGFMITNENAPAVAELCNRLDGLPLAIELAAARIKLLPPQAMLARLTNRLQLLTGGARDLPARQQTLRGAITWSYDLLNEGEKILFQRLAIFVGGCTIEAAEQVCQVSGDLPVDILDGVESLVDKSLIRQDEDTSQVSEPRFMMLETIHEFGLERLEASGTAPELRRRHSEYYRTLAAEAEPALLGDDHISWLDRLEAEYGNLRAALEWTQPAEARLQFAAALIWFWYLRGYWREGRRWLEEALAQSAANTPDRAKALFGAGGFAWFMGDLPAARSHLEESVALWRTLGDTGGLAYPLAILGLMALFQSNPVQARAHLEESVTNLRAAGDRWGLAFALANLGRLAQYEGDYTQATTHLEESLALFRAIGHRWGIAFALDNLGNVTIARGEYVQAAALLQESVPLLRKMKEKLGLAISLNNLGRVTEQQGDFAQALALYQESLALRKEQSNKQGIAIVLNDLGNLALHQGDSTRAIPLYRQSLALEQELGNKAGMVQSLIGLAGALAMGGQPERAARLAGAAEALRVTLARSPSPAERVAYETRFARVRDALDDQTFTTAFEAGKTMPPAQALNDALA